MKKKTDTLTNLIQDLVEIPVVKETILMAKAGCTPEEIWAKSRLPRRAVEMLLQLLYERARRAGTAELKVAAHSAALRGDSKMLTLCLGARTPISSNPARAAMDRIELKKREQLVASAKACDRFADLSGDEAYEEFMKIQRRLKKLEALSKAPAEREYNPEDFEI